ATLTYRNLSTSDDSAATRRTRFTPVEHSLPVIIVRVSRGVRSVEQQGYASALEGLWTGLSRTLTLLERYAAEPAERLDADDAPEVLSSLQYRLHVAGEVAAGIVPPAGSTMAHEELSSALADARDATAEVVEALELGNAVDT